MTTSVDSYGLGAVKSTDDNDQCVPERYIARYFHKSLDSIPEMPATNGPRTGNRAAIIEQLDTNSIT